MYTALEMIQELEKLNARLVPNNPQQKFNFAIGHYWDETKTAVGAYSFFNGEIKYGSLGDANEFLSYANSAHPDKDWKIFKLVELDAR